MPPTRFKEANTGDTILTNPSVTDSNASCRPAQVAEGVAERYSQPGDTDDDGNFDPGETWTWSCTVTQPC